MKSRKTRKTRKITIKRDKKGRYITKGKKKIYLKGSLDAIKRYIKNLFRKERATTKPVVQYISAPKEEVIPQVIPVQTESGIGGELYQKTKPVLQSIARDLGIRSITAYPKPILIEKILEAGWSPAMEKIPEEEKVQTVAPTVRGRKPEKPALVERLRELTGRNYTNKSIAQLREMISLEEEKINAPMELVQPKPVRRGTPDFIPIVPAQQAVVGERQEIIPSPPPEEVKIEEPTSMLGSVKRALGYSPPKEQLFNLKKTYTIPFKESTRYLTLLTGTKNPTQDDIFKARAQFLNISPTGEVSYNMPSTLNKSQLSALAKIIGLTVPPNTKKDEVIDMVKMRLDQGVLDPDNERIKAEAEGKDLVEQSKVNLDEPLERSSPPVPAEMTGEGSSEDDGISNFKIDNIMSKFPHYLGTIGHDQIKSKILPNVKERSKGGFIINTDPIKKKGEHWQAVYFDGTDGGEYEINFFDSYADPADDDLLSDLKSLSEKLNCKLLLKYKDNRVKLQNNKSSNCGWFCIKFLTDRFRGKPFKDASGFSDVIMGEKRIEKFKRQHGGFIQYLPSFGRLIPEKVKQFVKEKLFFPPNRLPPSAQKVLDQYKDAEITGISVQREPVNGMITKFLNFISLGKFGAIQKKLGYDRFYHLSMNVATTKGRLKIEKNARINIVPVKFMALDNYGVSNVPKGLTVEALLEKARKSMGDTPFFQYDALNNNCQKFILGILKANIPLLSKDLVDFIYQPVEELVKGLPEYVKKIASFATDTGAKLQQVVEGGKKNKKKNKGCL